MATSPFRTEKDSMGPMEVPADAYYGAQTRRAELNFEISPLRAPRALIRAMGLIKKAAAQVNMDLGLLNPDLGAPIVQAAQAVADGKHDDQFVVDIFQTGSGTSTNMNANEVIASRANEIAGGATGKRGGKDPVHPNDHVNMEQSSNDVIPTAMHVSAALRPGIVSGERRFIPFLVRRNDFQPLQHGDEMPDLFRMQPEYRSHKIQVGQAIFRFVGNLLLFGDKPVAADQGFLQDPGNSGVAVAD